MPHILTQQGLRLAFNTLCDNVGLLHFVIQDLEAYVGRYHASKEDQPGVDRVSFLLMNREYLLTLDEWCHYFGFDNSTTAKPFACFTINTSPLNYFSRMKVSDTLPQGNNIECPAIRYLYYVIANTLQACGDFTRVNEEGMMVLAKDVFPNSNIRPNLGALLIIYLKHQELEAQDPIWRGGVIKVLARGLNINVSNLQALEGPPRLGFTNLNGRGMVRKMNGRYYFNIPGADHLIASPLPNGVFSIEDGRLHYDAHVEANLPQQNDEPEGEDVEEEHA
jgi:hypothetical protein